jgi:methionyl-tRNA synthetase
MRYYLTTPIYYVNSTPHIGHAYTTMMADILVRHHRQRGEESFFLTGVDEHATKVFRAAEQQGLDVREYVDRIAVAWQALPARVGAEPDFFIRTSDDGHKAFVRDFLQRMYDNGDVYEGVYSGLYCVGCEAFKTEGELIDGRCPDHGEVEFIEEKNYFFRLSAYEQPLLDLYEARPDFVVPRFRLNEARSFVAQGLQDFSISRAGQPWGIPLPWDESHVAYVWADALVNYVSALTYARDGQDLVETFWPGRHLLGKEIMRFHAIYWPAMLLSAGYEVPEQLFIHGHLLLGDAKISKSTGNVIDPLGLVDVYGTDAVRFWAVRSVSFGHDGDASIDALHERYERELGNDLGNLLSRVTAMIARYRGGELPQPPGSAAIADRLDTLGAEARARFDEWDLTGALEAIWDVVRELNRHVERTKPWELAKAPEQAGELDAVLYDLADGLRCVAVALVPFLPVTSMAILRALGQPEDGLWDAVASGRLGSAAGIAPAPPLFPRIEATDDPLVATT